MMFLRKIKDGFLFSKLCTCINVLFFTILVIYVPYFIKNLCTTESSLKCVLHVKDSPIKSESNIE